MIFFFWHVIHDTWQVTHGGGWTFSQDFSSLALMVWDIWYLEDFEDKDYSIIEWMNEWINDYTGSGNYFCCCTILTYTYFVVVRFDYTTFKQVKPKSMYVCPGKFLLETSLLPDQSSLFLPLANTNAQTYRLCYW